MHPLSSSYVVFLLSCAPLCPYGSCPAAVRAQSALLFDPEDGSDSRLTFSRFHESFLPLQVACFCLPESSGPGERLQLLETSQLDNRRYSEEEKIVLRILGVKDLMYLLIRFPAITVFVKRVFHSPILTPNRMNWLSSSWTWAFFLKAEQFNLPFITS